LKYQTPKLVVLDASSLYKDDFDIDDKEEWLRVTIDPLRLSKEKLQMIFEIKSQTSDQTAISYLLPFFRYHSRWDQLSKSDFSFDYTDLKTESFMGFRPSTESENAISSSDAFESISPNAQISEFALKYYIKIIEICKERGINVILLSTPRADWPISRHQLLQSFARSQEIKYLDYATPDNIQRLGLDLATDLKDENHLNLLGGIKVTKALGRYIDQNFTFTNKQEDTAYVQWNEDVITYTRWVRNHAPEITNDD
jgi:hypothetical protein